MGKGSTRRWLLGRMVPESAESWPTAATHDSSGGGWIHKGRRMVVVACVLRAEVDGLRWGRSSDEATACCGSDAVVVMARVAVVATRERERERWWVPGGTATEMVAGGPPVKVAEVSGDGADGERGRMA